MPVYLLELHAAIGAGRGPLIEVLRDRWGPHIEERFGQQLIGLWAGVGTTGEWPHVWSLTRSADADAFAAAFDRQYPMEARSTYAYEVWRHSLRIRSGGTSRLLDAVPGMPAPEPSTLQAPVTMLERVVVRPGRLTAYHEAVRSLQVPLFAQQDVMLSGSLVDRLAPNEVINLWAGPDWGNLSAPPTTADAEASQWWAALDELTESAWSSLLAVAPKGTLGT